MGKHYDIIGDVHGHATPLVRLLEKMGYRQTSTPNPCFFHPNRKAIFVGDLIDRGNENLRTLTIVKTMVDHGHAHMVLGNHEYNALCYHTQDTTGNYLRPHIPKNNNQHKRVLDEIADCSSQQDGNWDTYLEWFRTLPLSLELDGIRVIHACWDSNALRALDNRQGIRDGNGRLSDTFLIESSQKGSPTHEAIEILLKGKEIDFPTGHPGVYDRDGNCRKTLRLKWWMSAHERQHIQTYDQAVRADACALDQIAGIHIPEELLQQIRMTNGTPHDTPVFFGHYWLSGEMKPLNEKAACLDYSAGLGGPLVAYRWDGEETLDASRFVSINQ
ncbi:MAG: metallophosphoesterase [Candidatus Omnitrophota bacterium]